MGNRITRREFLKQSAAASTATVAAPSILSAQSSDETVRVAGIGVGGKGWTDLRVAGRHAEVVAFCDVDTGKHHRGRGGYRKAAKQWPDARGYTDFRKLLDEEHDNIDGVTISTPDHMHAPVTMMAMKRGLATYTQKPLTRTIHEARALRKTANETGVSTQMGNQFHSSAGFRTLVKTVRQGVIGKIKEAHTWSNRPIWPQGIERPDGSDPVPDDLDWDLWLGVASERPFKKGVYHPFNWRGWYDFGAGALGDMGCHIIDPVPWSLELGPATSVSYEGPEPMPETFPEWEILTYTFPGTEYTAGDEFTMTWSDGGKKPSVEGSHIPDAGELPGNGTMMIGEEGTLFAKLGGMPVLYPKEKFADVDLPRASGLQHYRQWIDGIRTGKEPNSSFAYAGPLTETVLLGVVASRVGEGKELQWDAQNLEFTNSERATAYVREAYRDGWEVDGL